MAGSNLGQFMSRITQWQNPNRSSGILWVMSSPADFYHSLPPVIKFYGTACLLTTIAVQLNILNPPYLYFDPGMAFKQLQLWRVVTNVFFLGTFSMKFGIRLLMLARYGVQLEKTMFNNRTAQFVWMFILSTLTLEALAVVIPGLNFHYMGPTIVFMLMYLWSREFSTARVSIMGLVTMQGFYLPWAMVFVNTIFGGSFLEDFMGIVVGHLYYFLTVLHPRAGGKDYLQAPRFMQKLLTKWGFADQGARPVRQQAQQPSSAAPPSSAAQGTTAFRGRSYRLDRD